MDDAELSKLGIPLLKVSSKSIRVHQETGGLVAHQCDWPRLISPVPSSEHGPMQPTPSTAPPSGKAAHQSNSSDLQGQSISCRGQKPEIQNTQSPSCIHLNSLLSSATISDICPEHSKQAKKKTQNKVVHTYLNVNSSHSYSKWFRIALQNLPTHNSLYTSLLVCTIVSIYLTTVIYIYTAFYLPHDCSYIVHRLFTVCCKLWGCFSCSFSFYLV